MSRAPSRAGSGRPTAANTSSRDRPSGLRLKVDPTLPSTHRAVVDIAGKRRGVVKPIGKKYAGSWDGYKTLFDSSQAAVRSLESHGKDSGGK